MDGAEQTNQHLEFLVDNPLAQVAVRQRDSRFSKSWDRLLATYELHLQPDDKLGYIRDMMEAARKARAYEGEHLIDLANYRDELKRRAGLKLGEKV